MMRLALLVALAAPSSLAAVELVLRKTEAMPATGMVLEWEVQGADPAWLDRDCRKTPRLELSGADGSWTRAAFLVQDQKPDPGHAAEAPETLPDGEPRLRIRHCPRTPGLLSWVLRAPDGSPLGTGSLSIAAGTQAPGPLRISKDNPRFIAFADGTPFIPIGPNICWSDAPDRAASFQTYFQHLAEAGGNHTRLWMCSWSCGIQDDDPDAVRQDQAWLLDRALAAARACGMRLTIVLDNHHDLVHGKRFPYGASLSERQGRFLAAKPPEAYERRLRYILARWGCDDSILAWELFNELDLAQPVREVAAPWALAASKLLAGLDQDRRLRTISWAGADFERVMDNPLIDIVQLRGYVLEWAESDPLKRDPTRDGVGMLIDPVYRAQRLGRPLLLAESGYQGSNEVNPGNDADAAGLLLLQQAWAGWLLGGCGPGMNWWWDTYIERQRLWPVYRGLKEVAALVDWRDRDLAPLTPNASGPLRVIGWVSPRQALIWPQLRQDTWHRSLALGQPRPVLAQVASVRLGRMRPGAAYSVSVRAMRDGAERSVYPAQADATGTINLGIPAGLQDAVLLLKPAP